MRGGHYSSCCSCCCRTGSEIGKTRTNGEEGRSEKIEVWMNDPQVYDVAVMLDVHYGEIDTGKCYAALIGVDCISRLKLF